MNSIYADGKCGKNGKNVQDIEKHNSAVLNFYFMAFFVVHFEVYNENKFVLRVVCLSLSV
jgi:hypothetical protein